MLTENSWNAFSWIIFFLLREARKACWMFCNTFPCDESQSILKNLAFFESVMTKSAISFEYRSQNLKQNERHVGGVQPKLRHNGSLIATTQEKLRQFWDTILHSVNKSWFSASCWLFKDINSPKKSFSKLILVVYLAQGANFEAPVTWHYVTVDAGTVLNIFVVKFDTIKSCTSPMILFKLSNKWVTICRRTPRTSPWCSN